MVEYDGTIGHKIVEHPFFSFLILCQGIRGHVTLTFDLFDFVDTATVKCH